MDAPITRRDFLNGASIAVGGSIAGGLLPKVTATGWAAVPAPQDAAGYCPSAFTGLRGSHPGSFEAAHSLRDGDLWSRLDKITDTGEHYDLVTVSGGISGLSAANFFRSRRKAARILILDNHDDFGGHAKRNEFQLADRLALINGGTFQIDSPRPYSTVADGLLKELGIDPVALANKCTDRNFYRSLGVLRRNSALPAARRGRKCSPSPPYRHRRKPTSPASRKQRSTTFPACRRGKEGATVEDELSGFPAERNEG